MDDGDAGYNSEGGHYKRDDDSSMTKDGLKRANTKEKSINSHAIRNSLFMDRTPKGFSSIF